jgi:hypothetical protein
MEMEEATYRKQLIDLLSEILRWTKFIGKQQLKAILLDCLKEDLEKLNYELCDGKSLREIEKICKDNGYSVGKDVIKRYWDKWKTLGIVEPSKRFQGRYERIISLREVGIDFPEIQMRGKGESES